MIVSNRIEHQKELNSSSRLSR